MWECLCTLEYPATQLTFLLELTLLIVSTLIDSKRRTNEVTIYVQNAGFCS